MFRLICTNRFELLLDGLLERLADAPPDPFAAPQVVVPSAAIARRIEFAIAQRDGVCANLEFAFLAQWLWRQIARAADVSADSPFAAAPLQWRVYQALTDGAFVSQHPRLHRYLQVADPVMRLEFAQRVAALLEGYVTYRPRWLEDWAAGRRTALADAAPDQLADEAWQSHLWRRIAADVGAPRHHPSRALFAALEAGADPFALGLPPVVDVFALPSIAPLHLEILQRLSRWIEVRYHALNPSAEYWFDVVDRRRLGWLKLRGDDRHREVGNPLLASWGRATQGHLGLLFDDGEAEATDDDCRFEPAPPVSMLAHLQNAVLLLADPAPGSLQPAAGDRSVEVHVCHSLVRELEALHDRLLALFADDPSLRPQDVLVVTPRLEAAAAAIDAVFGTAPVGRRIPYLITGQPQRRVNRVARAFHDALALVVSRLPVSAVFELLEQPPVARRFGLDADDLDLVRDWVRDAGIHWGADAEHRATLGLPADPRHSLDDGLHRLFLGYALGDVDAPVAGRLPAAQVEGQQALALGRLARFASLLFELRREWRQARTADQWRDALLGALGRLVAAGVDELEEYREVESAIAQLHRDMRDGGLVAEVPLDVVRRALAERLDDAQHGGTPGGAVTFAALAALRGLPYRVVCALGLDDGVFPSASPPAEFDLIAAFPQRGDRRRRDEERNLFLDLMLAAREVLHLSYTGRSVRDNSPMPPSVLVAELLDHLAVASAPRPDDPTALARARARFVVEHPLQPFSLACFAAVDGDAEALARRPSFQREYRDALRERCAALASGRALAGAPVFFPAPLPCEDAPIRRVDLAGLQRFLANPARALLRDRLGVALHEQAEELEDDEPMLLERRSLSSLADRLLPLALDGHDGSALQAAALAGVETPAGALGLAQLALELDRLHRFAQRLRPVLTEAPLPPRSVALDVDVAGERWQLHASFTDLREAGLIRYRYRRRRARDLLEAWLEHLALCAAPALPPVVVQWHDQEGSFGFRRCEQPLPVLAELIALYRAGLSAPCRFFPRSAWAYVRGQRSLSKARDEWEGNDRSHGEGDDAAYRLALRGVADPLDERFEQLAQQVFEPLLAHLEEAP